MPRKDSVHMERAEAKTSSQAKLRDLIPIQSTWNVPRQSAIKSVTPSSDKNGFSPHGTCRGKVARRYGRHRHSRDSVHMERAEAKGANIWMKANSISIQSTWNVPRQSLAYRSSPASSEASTSCHHDSIQMEYAEVIMRI